MATPFDDRGRVDDEACVSLMHHLVANGSDGIVLSGTTGEASTLTDEEKIRLFELGAGELRGQATVIAGTGSNDTAHSVHLTEIAANIGVDAVLVVTPYYNRPPRAGIVGHVKAIAAVGVPVILYNIPSRSITNIPPDLVAELSEIPEVVGIKEANPDQVDEILRIPGLQVYAGNDDLLLPIALGGGAGVISVASHLVGDRMRTICELARAGETDAAWQLDSSLAPLYAGLFATTGPILIKAALAMLGLIPTATLRLPLVEATDAERGALAELLASQGVLVNAS